MDGDLPVVSDNPFGGPVAPHPLPSPSAPVAGAHPGEASFGRPTRPLRKRVGGAAAGVAAVAAKFGAYLKGGGLLLLKLKFLTTGLTALVSIAAYSLLWGWPFAAGFVALMVRARDGPRHSVAP